MLSSLFSCESSIVVELEVGDVGFCGGRKIGEAREKPSEHGTNAQMAPRRNRIRSNQIHTGERLDGSNLYQPLKNIHRLAEDMAIILIKFKHWIITEKHREKPSEQARTNEQMAPWRNRIRSNQIHIEDKWVPFLLLLPQNIESQLDGSNFYHPLRNPHHLAEDIDIILYKIQTLNN